LWSVLQKQAFPITVASHHAHLTGNRFRHPIGNSGFAMDRRCFHFCVEKWKWRFHDEMQPPIRPDQQREVIGLRALVRSGNVEDSLRVLKENVHCETYRLAKRSLESFVYLEAILLKQIPAIYKRTK